MSSEARHWRHRTIGTTEMNLLALFGATVIGAGLWAVLILVAIRAARVTFGG